MQHFLLNRILTHSNWQICRSYILLASAESSESPWKGVAKEGLETQRGVIGFVSALLQDWRVKSVHWSQKRVLKSKKCFCQNLWTAATVRDLSAVSQMSSTLQPSPSPSQSPSTTRAHVGQGGGLVTSAGMLHEKAADLPLSLVLLLECNALLFEFMLPTHENQAPVNDCFIPLVKSRGNLMVWVLFKWVHLLCTKFMQIDWLGYSNAFVYPI